MYSNKVAIKKKVIFPSYFFSSLSLSRSLLFLSSSFSTQPNCDRFSKSHKNRIFRIFRIFFCFFFFVSIGNKSKIKNKKLYLLAPKHESLVISWIRISVVYILFLLSIIKKKRIQFEIRKI